LVMANLWEEGYVMTGFNDMVLKGRQIC